MSNNAVAAIAVFCIFGAPIAAFIIMRVLSHRERIEMIRRGMMPPQAFRHARGWQAGSVAPPPVPPPWVPGPSDTDSPDRSLRKGITLGLIGLALLIGLSFIGSDTNGPLNSLEIHPGPWLLGGLIPMFVGIAQIIVALLSGAHLGPPSMPPGDPYAGGQGPSRAAGPDYVYGPEPRTHSGYEELKRPVPPPDRR